MTDWSLPAAVLAQLADGRVRPWLQGRRVERVVVVPNRLVNVVTRS